MAVSRCCFAPQYVKIDGTRLCAECLKPFDEPRLRDMLRPDPIPPRRIGAPPASAPSDASATPDAPSASTLDRNEDDRG